MAKPNIKKDLRVSSGDPLCFGFFHSDGMCKERGCQVLALCRSYTATDGLDVAAAVVEYVLENTTLTEMPNNIPQSAKLALLLSSTNSKVVRADDPPSEGREG